MIFYFVLALSFFCGFSIMAIELLGGRILAPYFGGSIYVWGSIITIFMLALSLGYLLGGKLSTKHPNLKKYGLLFCCSSIAILPLYLYADEIMRFVFLRIEDPRYGSLSASIILFFIPTVVLGMIAPYSVRLLVPNKQNSGQTAGFLYFVSTLGSALGTIMTSFYLVLWFQIDQIVISLMALLFTLGVIALLVHRLELLVNKRFLLTLSLLVIFNQVCSAKVIHSEPSLYRNVIVKEQNNLRCMKFDIRSKAHNQSCFNLSDPKKLVFKYTQFLVSSLLLNPQPKDILVVGLGGGSVPMALKDILPDAKITSVEIDSAVIKVAKEFFNYEEKSNMKTYDMDGRVFVKREQLKGKKYDLIVLDAFNGDYIPEHMMTIEFLEEVKSLLTENGVLAANTFSESHLYHHESVTYKKVFHEFFNVKKFLGNRVIITSKQLPLKSHKELLETAYQLQSKLKPYGLDLLSIIDDYSTKIDWDTDKKILTDQFAPANLLKQ